MPRTKGIGSYPLSNMKVSQSSARLRWMIEAPAAGTPIVITSKGIEGLDLVLDLDLTRLSGHLIKPVLFGREVVHDEGQQREWGPGAAGL